MLGEPLRSGVGVNVDHLIELERNIRWMEVVVEL